MGICLFAMCWPLPCALASLLTISVQSIVSMQGRLREAKLKSLYLWVAVVTAAVLAYYIPLPLINYPTQRSDIELLVQSVSLMTVGMRPWLLALCLWQFFSLIVHDRNAGFPLESPYSMRVLLTMIGIAGLFSIEASQAALFWKIDNISLSELLVPLLSSVTTATILVFISKFLDTRGTGWGFWALLAGISVSGTGMHVQALVASHAQGVLVGNAMLLFIALTVTSLLVSNISVGLSQSSQPKSAFPVLIVSAMLWIGHQQLSQLVLYLLQNDVDLAFYAVEYGNRLNWALFGLIVGLGLLIMCFWLQGFNNLQSLLVYACVCALVGLDVYLKTQNTDPAIGASDWLYFSLVAFGTLKNTQANTTSAEPLRRAGN